VIVGSYSEVREECDLHTCFKAATEWRRFIMLLMLTYTHHQVQAMLLQTYHHLLGPACPAALAGHIVPATFVLADVSTYKQPILRAKSCPWLVLTCRSDSCRIANGSTDMPRLLKPASTHYSMIRHISTAVAALCSRNNMP
jgi:hypothetical protein